MTDRDGAEQVGDPACYAHLLCPECATLLDDRDHAPWCTWIAPDTLARSVD